MQKREVTSYDSRHNVLKYQTKENNEVTKQKKNMTPDSNYTDRKHRVFTQRWPI